MFDKDKFSDLLKKINTNYENMTEFAKNANFDRAYISKYIHKKLTNPPSPKILGKIATASKGITTYEELMYICGYSDKKPFGYPFVDNSISVIPLFISSDGKLELYNDLLVDKLVLIPGHQYFGYRTDDESMAPLLGINDIAIIEKTNTFEDTDTCLISLDNKIILIRKILDLKTHIELQPINYNFDTIKLTKEDMQKRNFTILGKVEEAKNRSAF